MKRTLQQRKRNNGKSGKQNKTTAEYGQLEENQFCQRSGFMTKLMEEQRQWLTRYKKIWTAPGIYAAAKRITSSCPTCQKFSSIKSSSELGGRPWACFPFQRLQIDYADMPSASGYKHFLVIVDQLSGWVEAFPTRKTDTGGVMKALLKEFIPRYGVPESIESDRGAHFTANTIGQLYKSLGIERNLHTPYHAQSSGQVERWNRTLKEKIAKISTNTGLKWPDTLHLALWDVQNALQRPIGLSATPAEILFGRHLAIPGTYIPAKTSLLDGDERLTQKAPETSANQKDKEASTLAEAAILEIREESARLETMKGPNEEWEDPRPKYYYWSELSPEGAHGIAPAGWVGHDDCRNYARRHERRMFSCQVSLHTYIVHTRVPPYNARSG
ncbi:hypothetical protein QYF61_022125 [Mycteria americana]|uniref:Integrase catalytic domain-containing protein n=1 Tax=Mycteria americana TaxID=33587 RepID=A0AAN7MKB4_MYCAM|nr:hypothetical protein QYF61_022125 [Mycteria americana]